MCDIPLHEKPWNTNNSKGTNEHTMIHNEPYWDLVLNCSLLNYMSDDIIIINSDWSMSMVNVEFVHIFGLKREVSNVLIDDIQYVHERLRLNTFIMRLKLGSFIRTTRRQLRSPCQIIMQRNRGVYKYGLSFALKKWEEKRGYAALIECHVLLCEMYFSQREY